MSSSSAPAVRFLLVGLSLAAAARPAPAQPSPSEEALKRMQVADGFRVRLVASEPDIRKPVTITFDDRGRMWVIQYLQYPTPAGLKPVKVDQYLRTVYDRVPGPPPTGPKGADRITILEDPDETGRFRKVKDFHVGLNLASGMCLGYGGVFVVQPPYLLFYKIKEGDDVPAGDPEVLLEGFGMEDAHAFANSLQWGPDGWLYGAHGSTVTAKVRGIEFQQGIWRYRPPLPPPLTKGGTEGSPPGKGGMAGGEFELFAEGGGNTWGLDFDHHGNVIAGTNWGGYACLHQVQGGYYVKGFAKHGPLHNPYTFGYFDHVPYTGFKGGHVTCGGIVYQGGAFPEKFNNQYVAANLLANAIHWHILEPVGSSFTARHGGELITSSDRSFRPIDCLTGPDGAVYIADWADRRANHVDPVDNWDRTRGRIWKLEYIGASGGRKPPEEGLKTPLGKLSSQQLVGLLSHPNDWFRREARRILMERRDASVVPILKKMIEENKGQLALEALWALYVSGGFDEPTALRLLDHPNEHVRAWTVRLVGDSKRLSPLMRQKLTVIPYRESSPRVRSQLAASAKRLPVADAVAIVRELLRHDEDVDDAHIPLLLWWALEQNWSAAISLLDTPEVRRRLLVQKFILERLARRLIAAGDYAFCGNFIDAVRNSSDLDLVLSGFEKALEGRSLPKMPGGISVLENLWREKATDATYLRVMLRLGDSKAYGKALASVADLASVAYLKTPADERVRLLEILGQIGKPEIVPVCLQLLRDSPDAKVRQTALGALQSFPDPTIASQVLDLYPRLPNDLKGRAQTLLCSRPASSLEFLKLVDAGTVNPKEVPLDQLQRMVQYKEPQIQKLIEKHWGKVGAQTSGEKQSRMRSVALMVRRGKGDANRGKALFAKNCGNCHQLFGEGNKVGPELTGIDRKNLDLLVHSIVDPSAFIRPEFVAYNVATRDGRVLTGLLAEDSPRALTLLDAKNERTVLARDAVDELSASPVSLMPEKLLDPLSDQEICDVFAYLQSNPSAEASGGRKAPEDKAGPLKVLLISGSLEYKSDDSLAAFQKHLEDNYKVRCLRAFRKTDSDIPGLEQLDTCDVALLFTRRLQVDGEQLERIKKYCKAGKPIVAVRTASHGFQKWLELDKEILGGNYSNHYQDGPLCEVKIAETAKDHPILAGVSGYKSAGSLYKNPNIAKDCQLLLTGSIPDHTEPIAWTRVVNGGRVFYTSLGHQKDFQDDNFKRLLTNALFWTASRSVEKK